MDCSGLGCDEDYVVLLCDEDYVELLCAGNSCVVTNKSLCEIVCARWIHSRTGGHDKDIDSPSCLIYEPYLVLQYDSCALAYALD